MKTYNDLVNELASSVKNDSSINNFSLKYLV